MKKRNSFAILSLAGVAVLGMTACNSGEEPGPEEHQHSFSELHEKVDPTCLTEGREAYYTCDGCDKIFNENKEEISEVVSIPTIAHVPHHHEEVPAGCETNGTGEYWTCDNEVDDKLYGDATCSQVIEEIPVLDASGHKLTKVNEIPATCTKVGCLEYYTCSECDACFADADGKNPIADLQAWKNDAGKLPMVAHQYGKATVEWNGKTAHAQAKCANCDSVIEETKDGNFVEDSAATCHSAQTGHYEVTFNDTRFGSASSEAGSATGTPATGNHTYGQPEYSWNESTHEATATAKCTSDGCDAKLEETKAASFVEDRPVSCYQDQLGHYEVTFNDTRLGSYKTANNSATGTKATGAHSFDYANAEITWSGIKATATAKCTTNGCTETVSETKDGTFVKDTDASCTAPEKGHYEVTFSNTNFGSARTAANGVENGQPLPHTLGDLVPQVDALRENDGKKAYYQCSECHGYFNASQESVTAESLVIPAPAKHYDAAKDLTINFEPIATTETIYVDIKFVNAASDSKINISLLGVKASGGSDWDNFLGYYELNQTSVANNAGISVVTTTDDGYLRVKIDMNAVTKISGTKPAQVNALYVRGGWSNVEGYIELNSGVVAHTMSAELIPAKAVGPHGDYGYQAHYVCTGCDKYWFDESGNLREKEELMISNTVKYAPPSSGDTMAEFKHLGNISTKLWFDIQFDNLDKHQELGFHFYESEWDNYYGVFWVDYDPVDGVFFEGDYAGLELDELADGWWRVTAYPAVLGKFVKDKDIEQKHSIDFVWIKGPGTVKNRGYGTIEYMSEYDQVVPSTKVYSLSGKDSYTTKRNFIHGDIINLDFQIKNNKKVNMTLMQNWDAAIKFNVQPNGVLEDEKNGIQVFKLNNELAGYPTLQGTWYRAIIDTNYAKTESGMENFTTISRIGGSNWNEAEFDLMINSPYTTDGWYTIQGGTSNTKIQFKTPTPLAIKDANNQLLESKALYLEVKATGSGKAYFAVMDYDWNNCGKYVLTFENGVLTDCVVQGSANKWPVRADLGNGVYSLTLNLVKLPGDGLDKAQSIGFFYNGDGVLKDGLSDFSINPLTMKLVEATN